MTVIYKPKTFVGLEISREENIIKLKQEEFRRKF